MRTVIAIIVLIAAATTAHASNARADRTRQSFIYDQQRRQFYNQQWARQYAQARMDQQSARQGHRFNADGSQSRTYQMWQQSRTTWNRFQQRTDQWHNYQQNALPANGYSPTGYVRRPYWRR